MCGIYGTTIPYHLEQVKQKLERTSFRGPDRLQYDYMDDSNTVIFGHNRLAIIDLDPRSNQPFNYEHLGLVFNGEIYNFKALKKELINDGYTFRTESDTEVICALYLKYGESCVEHLNGMFAFVIYDSQKQLLFGARDRLGQKPLYIYKNGKDFEFSSQISSIQLHHKDLSISKKAINYYLSWGNVPDPHSIFNEVEKLLPGHHFRFDLNSGDYKTTQYWDVDYKKEKRFDGSLEDATEQLDTLLTEAVDLRLFADVPVGVFLSGGIDSSLIAALASKVSSNKIKTFSVKFNEDKFDESQYARKVATHLDTDHHEIVCHVDEGLDLIENFSHYYDEPFADSSAIPTMLLSKHTRKHVTVALSGDAGDELFIGYSRYITQKAESLYNIPKLIRQPVGAIMGAVPNYKMKVISKAFKIKDFNDFYLNAFIGIDHSWITKDFDTLDVPETKYLKHKYSGNQERMATFDLKTYLNWDINTKVDRAAMAFSLETRSPLMDYRVAELANSLPVDYKIQGENQKRILKDVLYKYVPEAYFQRPKSGFTMPFSEWFRGHLKDMVLSELSDNELSSIPGIDAKEVSFRIKQHMNEEWDRYPMIWRLLVLKQWLKNNKNGYQIK